MNDVRHHPVLSSLDRSIELFAQLRTADAQSCIAYDTLKQARALIARALTLEQRPPAFATDTSAACPRAA